MVAKTVTMSSIEFQVVYINIVDTITKVNPAVESVSQVMSALDSSQQMT